MENWAAFHENEQTKIKKTARLKDITYVFVGTLMSSFRLDKLETNFIKTREKHVTMIALPKKIKRCVCVYGGGGGGRGEESVVCRPSKVV